SWVITTTCDASRPLLRLFVLIIPCHPKSTLFPYTTLFRSRQHEHFHAGLCGSRPGVGPRPRLCRPDASADFVDGPDHRNPRTRRSEEHTSELQSQSNLVCRLLLEKKNQSRRCR